MMASRLLKAAMLPRRPKRGAALLLGGLLAAGCSHAWDALEPLPGSAGTGGNASVSASASAVTTGTGGGSAGGSSPSTGISSSAETSSSSVASASGSGAGGNMPLPSIEYPASVAECIGVDLMGVLVVDPALCERNAGFGQLKADENDSNSNGSLLSAYLRFDLDGALAGKSVDAVTLRLVVTTSSNATSDNSGEIRQVKPFVESDLTMAAPPDVSMEPVGADQGPVTLAQVVEWALPTNLVTPDMPVFLRLFPRSGDGVSYWNKDGPAPPRLIIQYH